ncbi:hypothetical protein WJX74_000215 [Apatococcus lobatus]|uniref:Kinesin motor domain-containing protein n=1 Tax=Apatococcus lobatus TaxID=904363 RepID=A0AAW1S5A4_9CHLO
MEKQEVPPVGTELWEPAQCLSEELVNAPGSVSVADEVNTDRLSELFPRNLNSLFASTPAFFGAKSKSQVLPHVARSLVVAGSSKAAELDLDRMQVVVRVRPQLAKGIPKWSKQVCVHAVSSCSVAIAAPEESQMYKNGSWGQTYTFSRVFPEQTSQHEYFRATAAAMVQKMVRTKQHSSVMMAYGISASGKTHTIEGTKSDPGVLPQALRLIFQEVANGDRSLSILVQNYEVYNETIFDLLDQHGVGPLGQRQPLRVTEDANGQVMVAGLTEMEVRSPEEALAALRTGSKQRQRAATALTYSSSRSHSIFTICLCRKDRTGQGEPKDPQRLSRMSFVDLAGSERAARTGNVGARLKESVAINSSLMTLGRCLETLRWNQQHASQEPRLVPYRESKVTHIFRDVLHGWGQILLSVNISPDAADYDETAHVLRYAALATQICNAGRARPPLRPLRPVSPNLSKRPQAAPPVPRLQEAPIASMMDKHMGGQEQVDPELLDKYLEEQHRAKQLAEEADGMHSQLHELQKQVQAAEERAALAETVIREEVSAEMGDLLREMEATYKERLAAELGQGLQAAPVQLHPQTCSEAHMPNVPQSKVEELQQQNLQAERQHQAVEESLCRTPITAATLEASKAAGTGQTEAMRSSLNSAWAQILQLEEQLDQHAGTRHQLDQAQAQILMLEQQTTLLPALRKQLASQEHEQSCREELASICNQELEHRMEQLQDQLSGLKDNATALAEARKHVSSMQASLQDHEALVQAFDAMTQHVLNLETRHQELQLQMTEVTAKATSRDGGLQDMPSSTKGSMIASLMQRVSELETEIEGMRASAQVQNATVTPETAALLQKIIELEAEMEGMRADAQGQVGTATAASASAALLQRIAELEDEVEGVRADAQEQVEAAMRRQDDWRQHFKRHSTQLQANAEVQREMVEGELEQCRKSNVALRRRAEAAELRLAQAGVSTADTTMATLQAVQAQGSGGRGVAGTPHSIALACARQAAAALSPLCQASLLSVAETPAQIWAGNRLTETPEAHHASGARHSALQPGGHMASAAAGRPTSSSAGCSRPLPTHQQPPLDMNFRNSPTSACSMPEPVTRLLPSRKATRTATSLARSVMLHNSVPFLATKAPPAASIAAAAVAATTCGHAQPAASEEHCAPGLVSIPASSWHPATQPGDTGFAESVPNGDPATSPARGAAPGEAGDEGADEHAHRTPPGASRLAEASPMQQPASSSQHDPSSWPRHEPCTACSEPQPGPHAGVSTAEAREDVAREHLHSPGIACDVNLPCPSQAQLSSSNATGSVCGRVEEVSETLLPVSGLQPAVAHQTVHPKMQPATDLAMRSTGPEPAINWDPGSRQQIPLSNELCQQLSQDPADACPREACLASDAWHHQQNSDTEKCPAASTPCSDAAAIDTPTLPKSQPSSQPSPAAHSPLNDAAAAIHPLPTLKPAATEQSPSAPGSPLGDDAVGMPLQPQLPGTGHLSSAAPDASAPDPGPPARKRRRKAGPDAKPAAKSRRTTRSQVQQASQPVLAEGSLAVLPEVDVPDGPQAEDEDVPRSAGSSRNDHSDAPVAANDACQAQEQYAAEKGTRELPVSHAEDAVEVHPDRLVNDTEPPARKRPARRKLLKPISGGSHLKVAYQLQPS